MLVNRIGTQLGDTWFLNDPDNGGGNGGGEPPQPAPPATTPTGGGEAKVTFTPEQQAVIDKLLGERAQRAGASATAEFLKALGVENADALKAMLDEGKKLKTAQMSDLEKANAALKDWETKYATLDGEAKKIPDLQKQNERYEAALKAKLEVERNGLPEHITKLLDKLDTVDQLAYIAENAATLSKTPNPIPGTPQPADPKKVSEAEKEERRKAHEMQVRSM